MVSVLDINGNTLPSIKSAKARILLKEKKAFIKEKSPFTIQLLYNPEIENRKENKKPSKTESVEEKKTKAATFIETVTPAFITGIIIMFLLKFVLLSGFIPSESMEPTIMTGNIILANRLSYIWNEPQAGDVVVFDSEEYGALLIKRVIGVSGDVIEIKNNKVYKNGEEYNTGHEVGKSIDPKGENITYEVPEGCLFLMGDNREHSEDSRYFKDAYVPIKDIKGKTFLHYSIGGKDGIYAEIVKH